MKAREKQLDAALVERVRKWRESLVTPLYGARCDEAFARFIAEEREAYAQSLRAGEQEAINRLGREAAWVLADIDIGEMRVPDEAKNFICGAHAYFAARMKNTGTTASPEVRGQETKEVMPADPNANNNNGIPVTSPISPEASGGVGGAAKLTEWDFDIPENNRFEKWPLDKIRNAQGTCKTMPQCPKCGGKLVAFSEDEARCSNFHCQHKGKPSEFLASSPSQPEMAQRPRIQAMDSAISDLGELAGMLRERYEPTAFDLSVATRLDEVAQSLKSVGFEVAGEPEMETAAREGQEGIKP